MLIAILTITSLVLIIDAYIIYKTIKDNKPNKSGWVKENITTPLEDEEEEESVVVLSEKREDKWLDENT